VIGQTYFGSQCTKYHATGWMCGFFMSLYLESCMWPDEISWWIRHRNSIRFCVNLRKIVMETLAIIRQVLREESMNRAWIAQTYNFLWHQGYCSRWICPSRPNSQFCILLWHFMATAWKKTCRDFAPIFSNKRTGYNITIRHCLTLPFSPKTTWLLAPTRPPILCFPNWR
jgi:hypothetical protein